LPICLCADDVELLLNISVDLVAAFQSEAVADESNAEFVAVRVVGKLLDELAANV